ncbi:T-box transcription factor TBX19-like [Sinocyclocheilus rhinocerous]|uniref:T-box transcription factor TBX19-like n=1 Tax=Sinocyclocheilus rhinocerous TaxID=307959 RepID=UPI0007B85A63|nr:PREDICTED: T-box transcription factor TBX19-like [Sinocyclocheilus rhinocerous]
MKVEEELRSGGGAVSGARASNDCCITRLLSVVESELQAGREKGDPTEKQLKVTLEDSELWRKFKELTNEMIVTKNGRRMFPILKVSVTGLDPNAMYSFLLDFSPADGHRWKYVNGEWVPAGKPEPHSHSCVYIHPDSPNFGAHWMKAPVSFNKVKLTNKLNGGGQIMLNSLHKYEPHLHIVETSFKNIKKMSSGFEVCLMHKAFSLCRSHPKNHLEPPAENQHVGIPHCGWFISNPDTLCSASGGNFPYPGGLPLNPHHGYKHYPSLHGHRATPYPSPYLPHHHHHRGHNSVALSENLSPGAVQMFSGHEGWTGVSPSGPAAMLSMQPAPSSAGASSQYPCLWTVSSCTVSSSPPGGIVSSTHSQEEPTDGGSTSTSPCSLLQGHGPTSSEGGVDQANHSRLGRVSWSSVSTHSF